MSAIPPIHYVIRDLIGCAWGRGISTPDETDECTEQAVKIVALHDALDRQFEVRVCQRHFDKLAALTDPHHDRSN